MGIYISTTISMEYLLKNSWTQKLQTIKRHNKTLHFFAIANDKLLSVDYFFPMAFMNFATYLPRYFVVWFRCYLNVKVYLATVWDCENYGCEFFIGGMQNRVHVMILVPRGGGLILIDFIFPSVFFFLFSEILGLYKIK